jgi:hypothetical protein
VFILKALVTDVVAGAFAFLDTKAIAGWFFDLNHLEM